MAAVEAKRPAVVVTDIRMPPSGTDEGIRAAALIRDSHPEIGVVVLSQYAEPEYALSLLAKGAAGRGPHPQNRFAPARPDASGAGGAGRHGRGEEQRRDCRSPVPYRAGGRK